MVHFLITPLLHSVSEMTGRKWRLEGGEVIFYISPNVSDADSKVLKCTDQETSHDSPGSISRAAHVGITSYVERGLVRGRALTGLRMINEMRTVNSDSISACFCFPADAKPMPSVLTDKKAIQEVKTRRGVATQLK
jgi:hypothetical protein